MIMKTNIDTAVYLSFLNLNSFPNQIEIEKLISSALLILIMSNLI